VSAMDNTSDYVKRLYLSNSLAFENWSSFKYVLVRDSANCFGFSSIPIVFLFWNSGELYEIMVSWLFKVLNYYKEEGIFVTVD